MPSQQLQPETTTSQRKKFSGIICQEEILYVEVTWMLVFYLNILRLAGMILLEAAM